MSYLRKIKVRVLMSLMLSRVVAKSLFTYSEINLEYYIIPAALVVFLSLTFIVFIHDLVNLDFPNDQVDILDSDLYR